MNSRIKFLATLMFFGGFVFFCTYSTCHLLHSRPQATTTPQQHPTNVIVSTAFDDYGNRYFVVSNRVTHEFQILPCSAYQQCTRQ